MHMPEARTSADGRELVRHGSAQLPVSRHHSDLSHRSFPWHWHDEMEALLLTQGTAVIAAGSRRYTLTKGQGMFIPPGVRHSGWQQGTERCQLHSLVFLPRLVGGSPDSILWQKYINPVIERTEGAVVLSPELDWQREALDALEQGYQAMREKTSGYEFQVREQMSHMVFLLFSNLPQETAAPTERTIRNEERIKTMLTYIDDHFGEELTVADIADQAAISVSECLRCFHSTLGLTPIQYVKQLRLQRAAELLTSTNRRIADIAAQCGFQDISYFTRSFKAQEGMLPSEYRKQMEVPEE
jgi:AraC-like DNA-binding protein